MARLLMKLYFILSAPISILFILNSKKVHLSYKMNIFRKLLLGFKMVINTIRIPTGTSYKSHLAMALKILETPPEIVGNVIECGCWKGGSSANLSLICRIVSRKLIIYDSFKGLPPGKPGDREAAHYKEGDYCGTIDEVKTNIKRYGAIECCEFVEGWFEDTLSHINFPVVIAFIDVDLEASLDTCIRCIWPNLISNGYIFIDEVVGLNYCALFYSEKYWKKYFRRVPPGLIGAGTGLPLGDYYIGPYSDRKNHPMQYPNAGAYTCKNMTGYWSYYPDKIENSEKLKNGAFYEDNH